MTIFFEGRTTKEEKVGVGFGEGSRVEATHRHASNMCSRNMKATYSWRVVDWCTR